MKKIYFLLVLLAVCQLGLACTTFCLQKNGQIIFGRNYDWVTGAGIVFTNQKGLVKSTSGTTARSSWVSKYGSITFNQYGKEFPTGGMNENGLVVELMWLDGTSYPEPDGRPELGVLRWIQYQLDNHETVKEVIASDKKIRIQKIETPIHYLVADAGGNVATIEFLNGKMVVHQGKDLPFPVLTNSTYDESIRAANEYMPKKALPHDNSLERFVKACDMVNKLKMEDIGVPLPDYAFSILDKVAQGSHTKWSIVYDLVNKIVYFKTLDFSSVKSFSFKGFDFSCSSMPLMYNLNQAGSGDISKNFTPPDMKVKKAVLDRAVAESAAQVGIGEAEKKYLLEFEASISCQN
jgi:penicillin V acylase-like amidase (Ntn superfamily)